MREIPLPVFRSVMTMVGEISRFFRILCARHRRVCSIIQAVRDVPEAVLVLKQAGTCAVSATLLGIVAFVRQKDADI